MRKALRQDSGPLPRRPIAWRSTALLLRSWVPSWPVLRAASQPHGASVDRVIVLLDLLAGQLVGVVADPSRPTALLLSYRRPACRGTVSRASQIGILEGNHSPSRPGRLAPPSSRCPPR